MNVHVERVSFAYDTGRPALRALSLDVSSTESVAVAGPNGSGKSTLLRIVSGVLRPDRGTVHLDGLPVSRLSAQQIARRIATVEQRRPMAFDFTVREVIAMGRLPHRRRLARESAADRRAIEQAMELADVHHLAERSIRAVSGGEQQRVYLGMAMAQEPRTLLLDEPTTHLDLRHQVQFMAIVRERSHEGMAVLMAIHDLTLAAQAADRILLLREGEMVAAGRPNEVLTHANVRDVFRVAAIVEEHPGLGCVCVIPRLLEPAGPPGSPRVAPVSRAEGKG